MIVDPITEEIRRIRHALAARYGNDLNLICEDLQRSEQESGREFISLPLRPARTLAVTKSLGASGPAAAPDASAKSSSPTR